MATADVINHSKCPAYSTNDDIKREHYFRVFAELVQTIKDTSNKKIESFLDV